MTVSDLRALGYRQVQDLLEIHAFYADAAAHYDEDEKARKAEARFWS